MSVDLKGNTNYVLLKDLNDDYVVPRTTLSAIDLNAGNGIIVDDNTVRLNTANASDVLQGSSGSTSVITVGSLKKAIAMGEETLLKAKTHTIVNTGATVEWTFNNNQIDVEGVATSTTAGIYFLGPLEGPGTAIGRYLFTCDVLVPSTSAATLFSLSGITFTAVTGYGVTTTTKGTWVRLAGLIDASTVITSNLNMVLTIANGSAVKFSVANVRLLDVTGFEDSDIVYLAGAGPINITADGETVIRENSTQYLYKPGYGIRIKGDTIELDTSVLTGLSDDYVYGVDLDLNWSNNDTSARIGAGIRRVVLDRSSGMIHEVSDFDHLPAHEAWRRCVMDDLETKHVNYYLDKNDSNLKEDHTPAVLTGEDGDVMVEWPITYVRVDQYTSSDNHNHQRWLVSLQEFDGSHIHDAFYVSPDGKTVSVQYIGAFRMGGCNYAGTPMNADENQWSPTSAQGTANNQIYYGRSIAGVKPLANINIQGFRNIADHSGGHIINSAHAQFLALMMMIEYGTNIQQAFNNGFASSVAISWGQYRLCGRTAVFGNNSTPTTAIAGTSIEDDGAGFYRPTFTANANYSNSTYVIRRPASDQNVGKLTYASNVYTRDPGNDVGYQITVGGNVFNRSTPFEETNEGITYYGWTYQSTTYYTIDRSPTTDSILYSDIYGDVSSATIEAVSDLYAWTNTSVSPTTIYTMDEAPAPSNEVTVYDYNTGSMDYDAIKGVDAYAWCPDKATGVVLYSAVPRPVKNDSLYDSAALTNAVITITSVAGYYAGGPLSIIQCSYRGIEDPFGSQWEFEDGAWALMTITVNGKKYYRGGVWNGLNIGGTVYYNWVRDFENTDVVWTQTKECVIGTTEAYVPDQGAMTAIGTVTDASSIDGARACDAIWLTTSTDAYAPITVVELGGTLYWRRKAADTLIGSTKYYGWVSEGGATIYTDVRQMGCYITASPSGTAINYTRNMWYDRVLFENGSDVLYKAWYNNDSNIVYTLGDTVTAGGTLYTYTASTNTMATAAYTITSHTAPTSYTISGTTATAGTKITAAYTAEKTYLHNYVMAMDGLPRANNYVKSVEPHTLFPKVLQNPAGANNWMCDYFYNNNAESSANYSNPRVVLRGGALSYGGLAGPFCVALSHGFPFSYWYFGSRLAV